MLRDSSLIPLSRQHHNGLALGILGRRALADDSSAEGVRQVAKRVIDYYEVELTNHFEIEEQVHPWNLSTKGAWHGGRGGVSEMARRNQGTN